MERHDHLAVAIDRAMNQQPSMPVPLDRSYWVSPEWLLAEYYPGDREEPAGREKLVRLLDAGIRSFVNLMEEVEFGHDDAPIRQYDERLRSIAAERAVSVNVARFPIVDVSIPSAAQMERILAHMDEQISAGFPVYLHCWGGRGRTGTVVGCWLTRHGIADRQAALQRIVALRAHTPDRKQDSPETESQRAMVRGRQPLRAGEVSR